MRLSHITSPVPIFTLGRARLERSKNRTGTLEVGNPTILEGEASIVCKFHEAIEWMYSRFEPLFGNVSRLCENGRSGIFRGETTVKRFVEGRDRAQLMLLLECLDDFVGNGRPQGERNRG
jgi:hypothetical protein